MHNRFIWNIDQDTIHFVNDFNFETPLEDNYITGDYLAADKSITLYDDNVNIPINLDYFIRLWKSSESDKDIQRDKVEVMSKESNFQKNSQAKSLEEDFLSKYVSSEQKQGRNPESTFAWIRENNLSSENIRQFFIPFIKFYNYETIKETFPDDIPDRPEEWRALSEEEVFAYVEQIAKQVSRNSQKITNQLIQEMMDRWYETGVPIDMADYRIDEMMINWNKVFKMIGSRERDLGLVMSNWKKTSDYNGWTNWETWNVNLMMENDYEDYLYFSELTKRNISLEDFSMEVIKRIIGPYNEQIRKDFDQYTDEEEVRMKMEHDLESWRSEAEIKYPDDPEAQEEYVERIKNLIYGFMGEPEPSDIAEHWLDESKVNWEEIYRHWIYKAKESKWKESKWKTI